MKKLLIAIDLPPNFPEDLLAEVMDKDISTEAFDNVLARAGHVAMHVLEGPADDDFSGVVGTAGQFLSELLDRIEEAPKGVDQPIVAASTSPVTRSTYESQVTGVTLHVEDEDEPIVISSGN